MTDDVSLLACLLACLPDLTPSLLFRCAPASQWSIRGGRRTDSHRRPSNPLTDAPTQFECPSSHLPCAGLGLAPFVPRQHSVTL
ncbi:hypothetical protein BKA81DRAFT_93724 [Phyllosticta paracitricarpa]